MKERQVLFKHSRLLFYIFWILLGLIQSRFTELQDDEAYYWVYSKFPAWGYFDHPPLTALLIKWGYAIFPNELGVRLFPLLLNVCTLLIIEKLIERKNSFLFYAIILSISFFQLAGFMAVPDTPLIFFTALFFFCYKKFRAGSTLINTLLLALSIGLLFYTKYHGLLVVVFTVLSDLRAFRIPRLYLCAFLVFVLYMPHLIWEANSNWISFRYHLFESNVDSYKLSYTISYLAGQIILAGPLVAFILLPSSYLYHPNSLIERSMKWVLFGFYLFFFISSFRGEVEPNWTSPALVPLVVLSHNYLSNRPSWSKWIFRLLPVSLLLIVLTRIMMIEDLLPIKSVKQRFHAWKEWPQEMKKRTNGLPVVFSNSYQRASKYWFYSGQTTYSLNHVRDHQNNYNFWPIEWEIVGKPVYFMDIYDLNRFTDSLSTPIGTIGYRYDSAFLSFGTLRIKTRRSYSLNQNDSITFFYRHNGKFGNYTLLAEKFQKKYKTYLYFFQKRKVISVLEIPLDLNIPMKAGSQITIHPSLPKGNYKMIFSVEVEGYNPTHNSDPIDLRIH